MTRSKRRSGVRLVVSASLAAIVVPLATGSAVLTSGPASAAPSTDWTAYLNGPSHNSYNPAATSITRAGDRGRQPPAGVALVAARLSECRAADHHGHARRCTTGCSTSAWRTGSSTP